MPEAPTPPAVSVIIVGYESAAHLPRCLAALEAQTHRDFEIILIDNASPDGGADEAALPANARLIRNAENLGFAGANNQGARESQARWIALLNPDAFPEPGWLAEMLAAADRHPACRMIGALQLVDEAPQRLDGAGDVYHVSGLAWRGGHGDAASGAPERDAEIFGPCGAAALYDREMFLAAGGFDERYFCYFEDVDLALRLRLAGERAVLAARAVVRHVGSASSGGRRSDFAVYHGFRNRLWTFLKCTPEPWLPLAVPLHAGAVLALLAIHALRGSGGPAWRGVRDAIAAREVFLQDRARVIPPEGTERWREAAVMNPAAPLRRGIHIRPLD